MRCRVIVFKICLGLAWFWQLPALPAVGMSLDPAETARPALAMGGSPELPASFQTTAWHTENGLPDGFITAMTQTPDGYLWVGSAKGLSRFDGVRFAVFNTASHPELPAARIVRLLVDRIGNLWIAFETGELFWYDEHQFHPVQFADPASPRLPNTPRTDLNNSFNPGLLPGMDLVEDAEGGVWFRNGTATLWRVIAGQAQASSTSTGLSETNYFALAPDRQGHPWLLAGQTWYQWIHARWQPMAAAGDLGNLEPVLTSARAGGLWLVKPEKTWLTSGGSVVPFPDAPSSPGFASTPNLSGSHRSQVTAALEDHTGRLWLGMRWGGLLYADANGRWRQALEGGPYAQSQILSLFESRDGRLWVGTLGDGMICLRQRPVSLLRLPDAASGHLFNSVCASRDGSMWAGTDGAGIFRFHQNESSHFGVAEGLPNELVLALLEDRQTNLWCATPAGICRFNGGTFTRVPQFDRQQTCALFADHQNRIWFGFPAGPAYLQNGKSVTLHWPDRPTAGVRGFAEDGRGNIWIATDDSGPYVLPADSPDTLKPVPIPEGSPLQHSRCVWCDPSGAAWFGTLRGGLFRYAEDRWIRWTTADGLPDDSLNSIFEDSQQTLWFASYNGYFGCSRQELIQYQEGKNTPLNFRWFSLAEGLDFRTCSGSGQPVVSLAPDGRIWFINQSSLAVLDPARPSGKTQDGRILIEEVRVEGNPVTTTRAGAIQFSSRQSRLEIHYTYPDFSTETHLHYFTQLRGWDAEWVGVGDRRAAQYQHLRPGHYEFSVMAVGPGGQRCGLTSPLKIEVLPRFWERRAVQGLGVLLIMGLAAGTAGMISRIRYRQQLGILEMKQATDRERNRIAQDLHDELGGSLTEIVMLADLAEAPGAAPNPENNPVKQIQQRAETLVRNLDEIVWAVDSRHDSLSSLIEYLAGSAQDFLRAAGLRTRLDLPTGLSPTTLTPERRHGIYLAAKEALNNIVRHAQASEVFIQVHVQEGFFLMALEDNGRGFALESGAGFGNGLRNMRERLQHLGGTCVIQSRPGQGTRVEFKISLK